MEMNWIEMNWTELNWIELNNWMELSRSAWNQQVNSMGGGGIAMIWAELNRT